MDKLLQDVRYAVRLLVKRPGFLFVAVTALALGIGANTAIFSVVNAVLLRPLPYPHAERLATLQSNVSMLNLKDMNSQTDSFEAVGGIVLQPLDYTGGAEPVQVQAGLITDGLFDVLGATAAQGRTILPAEHREGSERVVVLSHGFWQRAFGGDATIIGKTIPLSGNSYTVVGVLEGGFELPQGAAEVYAALFVVNPLAGKARGVNFLRTYWRLKPAVTLSQAQSEMAAIDQTLERQYPAENKGRVSRFSLLHERLVGETRPALLVLFGAVGLVLLIACANFANLLLVRAASRQQEIMIRSALGAGRGRLVRQMLTESVILSLAGGVAGLVLALWGIDLLVALKPDNLPRISTIGIDGDVLLFTLAISVLTGIIFGLVPALNATRASMSESLKEGGRSTTAGATRHRLHNLLVVSELAIALVLLVGAGLLIKGFWRLQAVDPGFNLEKILTMRVELPEARYKEIARQTQFRTRALDELNTLPDTQAAMISEIPLGGERLFHNFVIEGRQPLSPGEEPELFTRNVAGDYFRVMGIPLLKGRDFTPQDREGAPLVGIVNERFAEVYFQDSDPIGARVRWARGDQGWITIVGVASDVKHFGLQRAEEPALYTPYAQLLHPWKRWMALVVKSDRDEAALVASVKEKIWSIDGQVPLTKVRPMRDVFAASIAAQQFNMALLGVFAGVALLLATVGIYGVISYSVAQRTHEIGIRIALGAERRDVLALVIKQGMILTVTGLGAGLLASLLLTRLMSSLLFAVSPTDPLTFAAISLLLAGVALAACYVPARRATKVDPMIALRYE